MTYTHLEITSNYEMNGSNIRIKELVKKAVDYGYSSLAITDSKMYSAISFYKECLKNGIKPIFGLRINLEGLTTDSYSSYLLYAKDKKGYHNLLELASLSGLHGHVRLSDMKKYQSGLIAVLKSDTSEFINYYKLDQKNEMNEYFLMLKTHFEEFYISVSKNEDFNRLLKGKFNFVALADVTYLEEDDFIVHETLEKIFSVEKLSTLMEDKKSHFLSLDEVREQFDDLEAIANTSLIASKCEVELDFNTMHLPEYKLKQGVSAKDYLRALVLKGLELRLSKKRVNKKNYIDRVNYELRVIDEMGYNDYFLIVWDFVKYAKNKGYLVGPGRGSAAASLVSYCLGITSVDSLEYNLVFERFLNPERITMPDIDMDLPDDKRDEIIKYVRDYYGVDKVASICTFGTFLKKSAIRDTARVLKVEGVLLESIVKETDKYQTISEMIDESELMSNIMNQNNQAKELVMIASRVEGLTKHVSTHAAGIIVSKDRLMQNTPVQEGLLDMMQTQFGAKDLESLGLLKIDFLGLRNLSSIDRIVKQINKKEQKNLNIYKVPLDDKTTFDLLKKVDTTGVFQLESQGMRSLIKQMQVDSFEDIVTILALFRPGPMENIPSYIKRRNKEEKITYPHPLLKPILEPTNGIIIYQEQIIQIASNFAGYSLGEADLLRRAVSKKQEAILKEERSRFVSKSKQLNRDEKVSNLIYDYIVKFANYGFNRAHSVAYAMVSYWMAYLKANYPKYFIGVLTSSVIGSESMMKEYIYEANKLGVAILKPSVNHSTAIFEAEGDNLRYPLLGIKHVGRNAVRDLLHIRQTDGVFKSFVDFVNRTQGSLNKRVIESLIYAGALDEFGYSKNAMIKQLEDVLNFSLYGGFIDREEFVIHELDEYDFAFLQEKEKEILGFNLFVNPLNEYTDYISKYKLMKPQEVTMSFVGKEKRIVALISRIREIKTKNGKKMAFLTLSDEIRRLDAVLFTNEYQTFKDEIKVGEVYLLKGKVEVRNKDLQFVINNLKRL